MAARAISFSVREHSGQVWISLDERLPLPDRIRCLDPREQRFSWHTRWDAPVLDAQENFLDALHTHTVHPGLVRRARMRRPVTATLQHEADGFRVDYTGQAEQSGLLYRLFEGRRTAERAYHSALSVAQLEYVYESGWAAWITLCFTPETPSTTHVFASFHLRGRWAPGWLVRMTVWPFLHQVAEQDRRMLAMLGRAQSQFPGRAPVVTRLDLVRPHLEAAWAANMPFLAAPASVQLEV